MPVVKGIRIRRLKAEAPARKWSHDEVCAAASKPKLRMSGAFEGGLLCSGRPITRLRCVLRGEGGLYGVTVDPDTRNERYLYAKDPECYGSCWYAVASVRIVHHAPRRRKSKTRSR